MRLKRDDDFIHTSEGIEGEDTQRRGAIKDHHIEGIGFGLDQIPQDHLTTNHPGQFHLGGRQIQG